jgi:integrase
MARPTETPRILSPDQCQALWDATKELCPAMLPYLGLSLWCFLRNAEAQRTQPHQIHPDFVEVLPVKAGTASHRTVPIPPNMRGHIKAPIYWSKRHWQAIRTAAKLNAVWQENILRHTGISYLYQHLSEKAKRGKFQERSVIAEVCRQAGNTSETAFRHYIALPVTGASRRFYAVR